MRDNENKPYDPRVVSAIGDLHTKGSAAWPGVSLDREAFERHVPRSATGELPSLDLASDAYLAAACVAGLPSAIEAFDRAFSETIERAAARVDASAAFLDDVRQIVLAGLFVASAASKPKIREYQARAPLGAWVRSVAVRTALNMRRNKADQAHAEIDDERLGVATDPELGYLRARYKNELEASIRDAIQKLPARERTLLRLHLIDGLGIDVLGAHYKVGRSTAARWLAAARESLRERVRADLEARLGLSKSELASVAGLVRSQLETSAARLFRDD